MSHPGLPRAVAHLLALLQTPSPTGYTMAIADAIEHTLGAAGFTPHRTRKGAVLTPLGGEGEPLVLCAHMDTLGAMVRAVKDNGRLRFVRIGMYAHNCIENETCRVHTRGGREITGTFQLTTPSRHVYREQVAQCERDNATVEVLLDARTSSRAETEALGIRPGDFISIDPRTVVTQAGSIKSRYLDDKACVALLLTLAERIAQGEVVPARKLYAYISAHEEVGYGAASSMPADAVEILGLDMGCVGDDLAGNEHSVSICAKDSCGPFDYHAVTRLVRLAQTLGISHAVDIYPSYGSDCDAAMFAGHDLTRALIGPGIYASHGYERTHEDALAATLSLLEAYTCHNGNAADGAAAP